MVTPPVPLLWSPYLIFFVHFFGHLHHNSAPLAVVLSGHTTSLRQFYLWGRKWPKMAKIGLKMTKYDVIVKKMTNIDLFYSFEAFLIAQGWLRNFPPVGGLNGPKFWFCRREKFLMGGQAQTFSTSYMTQKLFYIAFSGNLGNMFLRKIHFCVHPFEPKKAIFDLLRGCFWPKTWKK